MIMRSFLGKAGTLLLTVIGAFAAGAAYELGRKQGKKMETVSPAQYVSGAGSGGLPALLARWLVGQEKASSRQGEN
jgi:hypothetical protein